MAGRPGKDEPVGHAQSAPSLHQPRREKVAVVDEVRQRLESASAVLVTEYRGLKVGELADLRRSLRAAGGDYKVYKNTLVKLAIKGTPRVVCRSSSCRRRATPSGSPASISSPWCSCATASAMAERATACCAARCE